MDALEFLNKYWIPIAAVFVGFGWLIRLEAKVLQQDTITKDAAKNMALMQAHVTTILQAVSRIQGMLEGRHDHKPE
jgi:hypothetical protein